MALKWWQLKKKSRAKTAKTRLKKDLGLTVTKEQSEKYGKVRKGAKGAVITKGGAYVKYAKKSKAAGSFRSAFKKGCAGDAKGFSWDGRKYSCAKASDKPAAKKVVSKPAAKKVASKPSTAGKASYSKMVSLGKRPTLKRKKKSAPKDYVTR